MRMASADTIQSPLEQSAAAMKASSVLPVISCALVGGLPWTSALLVASVSPREVLLSVYVSKGSWVRTVLSHALGRRLGVYVETVVPVR